MVRKNKTRDQGPTEISREDWETPKAFNYLASPATVAASATAGEIADPRPYFKA